MLIEPSAWISQMTTSPFSTSRTNFAPIMSSAQVSEAEDRLAVEFAHHQRADADRVAGGDQLGAGHGEHRIAAFHLADRVDEAVGWSRRGVSGR